MKHSGIQIQLERLFPYSTCAVDHPTHAYLEEVLWKLLSVGDLSSLVDPAPFLIFDVVVNRDLSAILSWYTSEH
jgi:hypothetical protein